MNGLLVLAALAAAAVDSTATPPDTSDAGRSPRVVRRLEEVVVRASPLHDLLSSETVQILTPADLRALPVDRLSDALALKAGVVAQGEELHVRGGRAGETEILLRGVPLHDPWRRRPMEIPLLALESAELVSGGLDAEYGGALAGVVETRTADPGRRWSGEARWESDGGITADPFRATQYDRVSARLGGPVAGGIGTVVAGEGLMDDTYLPALRTRSTSHSWRADNRILGFAKIAPTRPAPLWALETFGSRVVNRPYNPIWSLDGYTTPCTGPLCSEGAGFTTEPTPGYNRFRGADHETMSDEARLAGVLSSWRPLGAGRLRGVASWTGMRRLTSVGGRDDEWYLDPVHWPIFGLPDRPNNDPIFVYQGYEPFFQKAWAETYGLRGDFDATQAGGSRMAFGAGVSYDHVTLRELDTSTRGTGLDSLRAYEAFAPGGFVYAQGRWIHEGLVLNGGLRLEAFTAGPQAASQSFGGPAHLFWTLDPRLGVAYPVSTRDVLSFSYVRISQAPARDFLYENRVEISPRQPLGNPGLEPSTVISYQVALKHLFDEGRAVQLGFFFRDLFGQIGARAFETRPGVLRRRYENADEGHAEGFEVGLILPDVARGRVEIQYTFMHASGSQSAEEGFPYGAPQRIVPLAEVPLDWDQRHTLAFLGEWKRPARPPATPIRGPLDLALRALHGSWSLSWATRVGSPLPWTPSERRVTETDPVLVNAARFKWQENTWLALRLSPSLGGERLSIGLDVRNLFDFRSERAATASGYPHPFINTLYDDDGAFRHETGLPGGGYWDSNNPSLADAWVRIQDPRLLNPPRLVRLSVSVSW